MLHKVSGCAPITCSQTRNWWPHSNKTTFFQNRKIKHGQQSCLYKDVTFANPKEDEIAIVQNLMFTVHIKQPLFNIEPTALYLYGDNFIYYDVTNWSGGRGRGWRGTVMAGIYVRMCMLDTNNLQSLWL